jgi:hypothetical protein
LELPVLREQLALLAPKDYRVLKALLVCKAHKGLRVLKVLQLAHKGHRDHLDRQGLQAIKVLREPKVHRAVWGQPERQEVKVCKGRRGHKDH